MLRWTRPLSRRAILASALSVATITAAGATTYHRLAVTTSNGGGAGGALVALQTNPGGGAVQGEVAAKADTSFAYPFGLFGIYDGSSSTLGIGVAGESATGYGVAAASSSSAASILAFAEGTGPALEALTKSSSDQQPAILALPASGSGADGIDAFIDTGNQNSTTANYAISGDDQGNAGNTSAGVTGVTNGDNAGVLGALYFDSQQPAANGAAGVYGESTGNTSGYGVVGESDVGYGAYGQSTSGESETSGIGVQGTSDSNSALVAEQSQKASPSPEIGTQSGVIAIAQSGAGLFAMSMQDPAIVAEMGCNVTITNPTEQGQNCSGLFIQDDGTNGYLMNVYEPNSTQSCPLPTYPFFVDTGGNILQCGTTSTAQVYQRSSNTASDTVTYTAKQTEATVEDYGTAELVNGSANVALAPDFKETMDARSPYTVLMMPHGDCNDLYLASQNANGFVIRESEGGRSTVAFDYRIVARPYGARLARLPHESQVVAHVPVAPPSDRKSYAQRIAAVDARERALIPALPRLRMTKHLAKRPRYVPPPITASFASALQRIK